MGRFVPLAALTCILLSCAFLASCGHTNTTNVIVNPVPSSVSLTTSSAVGLNVSLEVGKTLSFTATARGAQNNLLTATFSFLSSNPAVVTIASNGAVCAGTWDSLTNPQVCVPGTVGTAQLTATSQGVSSPPITVYVHARITSITVSKVPGQTPTLSNSCLSKGAPLGPESWLYQATAMNGSTDITSSIGPFSWQQVNPVGSSNIVTLAATAPSTTVLNQEIVTASTPGQGMIFASATGLTSQTVLVETCPVQDVSISAANNPSTSLLVNTGTSTTVNATVTDVLGMTLTGVPLTWSTSNPISATASGNNSSTVFGSVGTVAAAAVGGASVTASCTPPTCNGGIKPSLPIYPKSAIGFDVRSSAALASPTAYVTTTACSTANPTNATCNAAVVPLTKSSSTSTFVTGTPVALPTSPNSILFDDKGTNAYLGVDSTHLGQNGAMVFTGGAASQFTNAFGTVLAVSPDTTTVIFSDTVDIPNQVFICNSCSATSRTITSLLITGATAAAFSPDNLKAYILAGSNLFVYSKVDALQKISLNAPATDAAFLGNGMFGYLAGGSPAGGASFPVCFDPALTSPLGSVATPGAKMVRALPDGSTILVLAPPDVETITASVTGVAATNVPGCPAPRGFLTLTDSVSSAVNLGQGAFAPTQFIISGDGATAYILGETQPNSARLPFIIKFDTTNQTSSLISLIANATPLSASLGPAGNLLFVGADDGAVHIIDTTSGSDTQQVTFPLASAPLCFGPGTPVTAVPKTVVAISSASQNGSNTTYTYVVNSGPALQIGETVVIAGMTDGGNDGTFTISALGAGTFTVSNTFGVTTTASQNGSGTVPITCNPDLVAVKP
jgi:trimeric autotransporter adhesin